MLTAGMSKLIVQALTKHVVAGNFDGPFNLLEMGLYKNQIDPNPKTALTDLTECAFPGYARVALATWPAPMLPESAQYYASDQPIASFVSSNASANETAYGWFLADVATHLVLYAVNPFASGVSVIGLDAAINVMAQLEADPRWSFLNSLLQ